MFKSYFEQNFQAIRCLGYGTFGVVYKAKSKTYNETYTIKRVLISNEKGLEERNILLRCNHKNIIRCFNSWIEKHPKGWQSSHDELNIDKGILPASIAPYLLSDSDLNQSPDDIYENEEDNNDSIYLYTQFELCQENNLQVWIQNNYDSIGTKYCFKIFKEITEGVQYLHSHKLIHSDLKVRKFIQFSNRNCYFLFYFLARKYFILF